MFGKNQQLPVVNDRFLSIKEVFTTIQGEGPHSGTRAVFVRAAGCNLACDFCDTDFDNGTSMTAEDLATAVMNEIHEHFVIRERVHGRILVVLTGGEPCRQNFQEFFHELYKKGLKYNITFVVQLETAGTLAPDWVRSVDSVVMSPKTAKVHPKWAEWFDAHIASRSPVHLKYIVDSTTLSTDQFIMPMNGRWIAHTVFVQPKDVYTETGERDELEYKRNLDAAIALVMTHGRLRLSLQTHKILGMR